MNVKLLLRERELSPRKKFWGSAGNQTQDLLNASQALLPLSHWCLWQRSGRSGWRSLAYGVAGLGGLTIRAHCPSGYYPPPLSLQLNYLQY